MPSLFRLLFVLALLGALVYGGMIALVTFVQVTPRPIEQVIPPAKLK
ncbi:histidine kinase [Lichenihabitans sp. PAMC28606]|nr:MULTISPECIES: histidine kinase [Lichenihabitans]UDL96588.1 histidine kinase [Lichenihabitans sp. PAMC28606]